MFPSAGRGAEQLDPIPHVPPLGQWPWVFVTTDQSHAQYQLYRELSRYGDCYCEVSYGNRGQIDLVWRQRGRGPARTIGLEIKTDSGFDDAAWKIAAQIERYRTWSLADRTRASAAVDDAGTIVDTDALYVFDEVWLVATNGRERSPRPGGGNPEDGWLRYDPLSGRIDYEIDSGPDRDTVPIDFAAAAGEEDLTARLWSHYVDSGRLVTAEVDATRPGDRYVRDGRVLSAKGKGQTGKTKQPDLVIGFPETYDPVDSESVIHAIEVKTSLDSGDRDRLDDQLSLFRDSGLFSHVWLAVPRRLAADAAAFLDDYSAVGLLSIEPDGRPRPFLDATSLPLEKVPIVEFASNGSTVYFGP